MTRLGAASGSQRWQEYVYTFRGVLVPIQFDAVGGDDAVRGLRILVVKSPTLMEMTLDERFPDYMQRRDATAAATGVMQIPIGTQLTFRARANKELVRVQVDFSADKKTPAAARSLRRKTSPPTAWAFVASARRWPGTRRCRSACWTPTGSRAASRFSWRCPRSPTSRRR